MKRLFNTIAILAMLSGAVCACNDYDGLREDIDNLDKRVTSLEDLARAANDNIEALWSALNVLDGKATITGVYALEDGNGYTIMFSDGKKATITNGEDGKNGEGGLDGENGLVPIIGIQMDTDGLYYWTLDGDWLLADGKKVRANGSDGKNADDGTNGEDGVNGITPKLRISNGKWQVSIDNGDTWENVAAEGEYVIFKAVDISDPAFITLELQDGTELRLSRGSGTLKSIVVVPQYSDGSIDLDNEAITFRIKVFPADAAGTLAALPLSRFSLCALCTKTTKAAEGDRFDLPVISATLVDGGIKIEADAPGIDRGTLGKLSLNAMLTIDDGDEILCSEYFPLRVSAGKGKAPVNEVAGRPGNVCRWVQLWEDGPKFAEFNVGATITDYGMLDDGTDPVSGNIQYYNTANIGGLYPWRNPVLDGHMTYWDSSVETGICDVAKALWGNNWREPTYDECQVLVNNELEWNYCDGSSTQYCPGCTLSGYKINGKKGTDYEFNSIFLPLNGFSSGDFVGISDYCYYWTGTVYDSYSAYEFYNIGRGYTYRYYGECVRAVLDESKQTRGVASVSSTAGRPANVCGWVQLWEGGPKFAEFNVGATITDYGMLDDGTDPENGNIPYYNTVNVGGLYPSFNPYINGRFTEWDPSVETGICDIATALWGDCWRTPTDEEWDLLVDGVPFGGGTGTNIGLVWTYCDGSSTQYCSGCTLAGYKVSGKAGSEYEYNSIFIPLAGFYNINYNSMNSCGFSGYYWASSTGPYDECDFEDSDTWGLKSYQYKFGNSVRAVLEE